MKTLIIDNYDSFTYIIKQYVGELGGNPEVFFHDKITIREIEQLKPTHIILSPGPGTVNNPKDVGITFDVIKHFYKKIPILGVCLGHHAICKHFGGNIIRAPKIMHGKRSNVYHTGRGILKSIKNPLEVMRYHSLIVDTPFWMNDDLDTIAHTKDFLIMAVRHKQYPVFGVQFHPESLGTKEGKKIINNFLSY